MLIVKNNRKGNATVQLRRLSMKYLDIDLFILFSVQAQYFIAFAINDNLANHSAMVA